MSDKKTAIITGASRGIGAGLVKAFVKEGYNVVSTSRDVTSSLIPSTSLLLVNGDIGKQETAAKTTEAALRHFGTIDVLVNNAGIFRTKPFTEFTTEDFNALVSAAVACTPTITTRPLMTRYESAANTRVRNRAGA